MENENLKTLYTFSAFAKDGSALTLALNEHPAGHKNVICKNANDNEIGYAVFKPRVGRDCFLYNIRITDSNYHLMGIGTHMLNLVEAYSQLLRCNSITGKFYPEGEGAANAGKFYENRGYETFKDGYETFIFKNDIQKIEPEFDFNSQCEDFSQ